MAKTLDEMRSEHEGDDVELTEESRNAPASSPDDKPAKKSADKPAAPASSSSTQTSKA